MDHKDFSNLGEQLRKGVQSAIDAIDFAQISHTITDSLNDAVTQAHNGLSRARSSGRIHVKQPPAPVMPTKPAVRVRWVGRYTGPLCAVFGALGVVGFGALAGLALAGALMLSTPLTELVPGIVLLCLPIAAFAGLLAMGRAIWRRIGRLRQYLDATKVQGYCQVERLAERVKKPEAYVLRDLRGMIQRSMLPDAHIDEDGGCLILDEAVYQLYLQSRTAQEQRTAARPDAAPARPTSAPGEADEMLAKGGQCINALREADRAIGKEVISVQLRRLETIVQSIFASLHKYPDQVGEMGKFIDYYLPTTVKLVQAYRDFDGVEIQGENIQSAKAEIEKTLDTIGDAFERVLNDLYQDAAFDAAADASVLQAMLAKDGWAGSDFEKEEQNP